MRTIGLQIAVALAVIAAAAVIFTTSERPPMDSIQRGYRGLGMQQVYNPRIIADELAINQAPASLPRLPDAGPKAGAIYKNVQVLGDESVGNFTRLMASMTNWVSPAQGCAYCHDVNNMASDGLYTKVVARRMIQMVQRVNSGWKNHVAETGVTCYTCHRGQPVPAKIWFHDPGGEQAVGMAQMPAGKNHPTAVAGASSLPFDPFTPFLEGDADIRVQSATALPDTNRTSIKQTDWTYSLMMNFSQSLGVNCTYCHNSRLWSSWSESPPQRLTAWYGIRMVRELNNDYLNPLHDTFPPARLGPTGDSPKVNCATCHNGVYKPLFGVSMAKDFPELTVAH
jgi:photosynthetic reaction center cytochrome c subunit